MTLLLSKVGLLSKVVLCFSLIPVYLCCAKFNVACKKKKKKIPHFPTYKGSQLYTRKEALEQWKKHLIANNTPLM